MCLFIEAHKNHVRDAVSRRLATGPVAALVLDVLCASMIDLAKELDVPSYIYMPSNATFLGLMLYLPTLHVKVPLEIEDVKDVINIPVLRSHHHPQCQLLWQTRRMKPILCSLIMATR